VRKQSLSRDVRMTLAAVPAWVPVVGLTVTAVLFRGKIAARLPGTRAHSARIAAESEFHATAARRLVAVGIPDAHSVRIWLRTDRPGPHVLSLVDPEGEEMRGAFEVPPDPAIDGTWVVRWPVDVGAAPLRPCTDYRYEVRAEGGVSIGEGRFTTAPERVDTTPDRLSVAIASCHQPFLDDGRLRPESLRLLEALEGEFDRHHVRAFLMLGDQMYTDLPSGHCLFDDRVFRKIGPSGRTRLLDCTREEVRSLFQERYRAFWKVGAFQRLQSRFGTLCILDDHELIDNYGTHPVHSSPEWAALSAGAFDAFHDYQALRHHDRPRPDSFPTRFEWGPAAGLVLDLRSQRRVEGDRIHLFGEDQWAAFDRFLTEEKDRPVLIIGLHVPEWVVAVGAVLAPWGSGVHDRWSHPCARPDRDRLVHRLLEHRRTAPNQQVILVSGDVHVGAVSEITFDEGLPILQVVSSAMSNLERETLRRGSATMADLSPDFVTDGGIRVAAKLLSGSDGSDNPYPHLNAGIISFRREGERWRVRVRLIGHDENEPERTGTVYDSGELPLPETRRPEPPAEE
jgi:alkaline phosphatase D